MCASGFLRIQRRPLYKNPHPQKMSHKNDATLTAVGWLVFSLTALCNWCTWRNNQKPNVKTFTKNPVICLDVFSGVCQWQYIVGNLQ